MQNIKILIAEELENNQLKLAEHLQKEGGFNVLGSYDENEKSRYIPYERHGTEGASPFYCL